MGEENKSLGNISKRAIKDPSVPFFCSARPWVMSPNVRARGDNSWVDSCWRTSGNTAREWNNWGWGNSNPKSESPVSGAFLRAWPPAPSVFSEELSDGSYTGIYFI